MRWSRGVCGVVTGAIATLKAPSGQAVELALVDFLLKPLKFTGVSEHVCVSFADSEVSGDGKFSNGNIGGGLGRHGDQFRRCEVGVWKVLIAEASEEEPTAASKEAVEVMSLQLRPAVVVRLRGQRNYRSSPIRDGQYAQVRAETGARYGT